MKANKVRDMDTNEITAEIKNIEEQMFRLKFQMSMGQMDGLKKVRNMRKDLARIQTIQRERELEAKKG